jgi:hypothetical protein
MTEELCGTTFSKSLVSKLAGSLDSELHKRGGTAGSKRRLTPTCLWTPALREGEGG